MARRIRAAGCVNGVCGSRSGSLPLKDSSTSRTSCIGGRQSRLRSSGSACSGWPPYESFGVRPGRDVDPRRVTAPRPLRADRALDRRGVRDRDHRGTGDRRARPALHPEARLEPPLDCRPVRSMGRSQAVRQRVLVPRSQVRILAPQPSTRDHHARHHRCSRRDGRRPWHPDALRGAEALPSDPRPPHGRLGDRDRARRRARARWSSSLRRPGATSSLGAV